MPAATSQSSSTLLVLPWNRLPNYLICVVALINVLVGIGAFRFAYGFVQRGWEFENILAAASIACFGLMSVWVGWCFRRGVLPAKFVADASRAECGFRWLRWWNGRFDLSETTKLIGEMRPRKNRWQWAILAHPSSTGESKDLWIYGSSRTYESAASAEVDCRDVISKLGKHLSLPVETRTLEQA